MSIKSDAQAQKGSRRLSAAYSNLSFRRSAPKIRARIVKHLLGNGVIDNENQLVFTSKDSIRKDLAVTITARFDEYLQYYEITEAEFWAFFGESNVPTGGYTVVLGLTDKNYIDVRVYPQAKKSDIDKAWPAIKDQLRIKQGFTGASQPIKYPDLLYSLMLERKKRPRPPKWRVLAKRANEGSLGGYSPANKPGLEWDEESIKAYYHDNKQLIMLEK